MLQLTLHHHYLISCGDLSLLINNGLNEIRGQGLPPAIVKEGVDGREMWELEYRQWVLIRLNRHLHQPKKLTRHTRGTVNSAGCMCVCGGGRGVQFYVYTMLCEKVYVMWLKYIIIANNYVITAITDPFRRYAALNSEVVCSYNY